MKYIMHLDDREVDRLKSEKIVGYKVLGRLSKYQQYGLSVATLPAPTIIFPPELFYAEQIPAGVMPELEKILFDEFVGRGYEEVYFRGATKPSRVGCPRAIVNVKKEGWKRKVENYLKETLNFSKSNKELEEVCGYAHPFAQPEELRASAEVITSVKKNCTCEVVAVYGCGYTLEMVGDNYVVDVNNGKIVEKDIKQNKKTYFKTINSKVTELQLPAEFRNQPVLPEEDATRIAIMYSRLENIFACPVGAHWTRKMEGEEYTIDFRLIKTEQTIPVVRSGNILKTVVLTPESLPDIRHYPVEETYFYIPAPYERNLPTLYSLVRSLPKNAITGGKGGKTSHFGIIVQESGRKYLIANIDNGELQNGDEVRMVGTDSVKKR